MVPASFVPTTIFGNNLGWSMEWPVGCQMSNIEKKGAFLGVIGSLSNRFTGTVVDDIKRGGIVIAARTTKGPVVLIESLVGTSAHLGIVCRHVPNPGLGIIMEMGIR